MYSIKLMAHWLLYVSLWNTLTILFVWWLVKVFVFTICREHSDALAKLQDKDFLVCPSRLFLKTFACLIVWLPIISGVFSIRLNAITGLIWNTPRNPVFTCRIFLCLFTILVISRSVSLYVINSGILWLVSFFLWIVLSIQFCLLYWYFHLGLPLHIFGLKISVQP